MPLPDVPPVCHAHPLTTPPPLLLLTTTTARYFETEEWNGIPGQWWFGGGTDITPNWVVPEDMAHFHGTYKKVRGVLACWECNDVSGPC
jgi:coproporphyrinogen III oxidase